jgi:hypothetical protein
MAAELIDMGGLDELRPPDDSPDDSPDDAER